MLFQIRQQLKSYSSKKGIEQVKRYFKTQTGDYAEQDIFIGVYMPEIKLIEKQYRSQVNLIQIKELLQSKIHEERRLALLFLLNKFKQSKQESFQKEILNFYLQNLKYVNNWDLVDVSAPQIVGQSILFNYQSKQILYQLIKSDNLWKRRISIVSTLNLIKNNQFQDALNLCKISIKDKQDLIHKASGWMLREIGKKKEQILLEFLDEFFQQMPRVMLRYSIEKLDHKLRKFYLNKVIQFLLIIFIK